MGIFAKRGLLDYGKIAEKNRQVQEQISLVSQANKSFASQIHAFQKSAPERERVIRERLGYIRPGEVVIEFE